MVLKTTRKSGNRKTGPIAVTNRSGKQNIFGTCPDSCQLMLPDHHGSDEVDVDYLTALRKAVPKNGSSWTYTHSIAYRRRFRPSREDETCINSSCDTVDDVLEAQRKGHPNVTVIPEEGSYFFLQKLREEGIKAAICPAQLSEDITCSNCGGAKGPWCGWVDRPFTVAFMAHGTGKKAASDCEKKGGCYAAYSWTGMQWRKLQHVEEDSQTDGETLLEWVDTLPEGERLRHHVVGDLMKDQKSRHFVC